MDNRSQTFAAVIHLPEYGFAFYTAGEIFKLLILYQPALPFKIEIYAPKHSQLYLDMATLGKVPPREDPSVNLPFPSH